MSTLDLPFTQSHPSSSHWPDTRGPCSEFAALAWRRIHSALAVSLGPRYMYLWPSVSGCYHHQQYMIGYLHNGIAQEKVFSSLHYSNSLYRIGIGDPPRFPSQKPSKCLDSTPYINSNVQAVPNAVIVLYNVRLWLALDNTVRRRLSHIRPSKQYGSFIPMYFGDALSASSFNHCLCPLFLGAQCWCMPAR